MSNDTKLYFNEFSALLDAQFQNTTFTYDGLVMTDTLDGEDKEYRIIDSVEWQSMGSEFTPHSYSSTDYEKRKLQAAPAYFAKKWGRNELARAKTNPIPEVVQQALNGLGRWRTAVIRDALTASTQVQLSGASSYSAETLSGISQEIAVGGAGLTEAKIRQIQSQFRRQHVLANGEALYLSVAQEEMDDLIQIEKFINRDYIDSDAMRSGIVGNLYGINIVHDEDLNVSGSTRTCIAWVKSACKFAEQQSLFVRMDELNTTHFNEQYYASVDMGALRYRGKGVMSVLTNYSY